MTALADFDAIYIQEPNIFGKYFITRSTGMLIQKEEIIVIGQAGIELLCIGDMNGSRMIFDLDKSIVIARSKGKFISI
jgi:hypothetical protein